MTIESDGRPTRQTVHVVVTCTNRKTRPPSPGLRLRDVPKSNVTADGRSWISRLESCREPSITARDLYAGEHWTIARKIPQQATQDADIQLWVCSAGYGLIPIDADLRPYAATFTTGHEDSVPGDDRGLSWWTALSDWPGPSPHAPRSVKALAESDPDALFILALSSPYARACQHDILAAADAMSDVDRIMVVSVGTRGGALADLMVPSDARLQAHLGGTRQALNVRVAAHLVSRRVQGREQGTIELADLVAAQPPLPRYDRKKLSDEEVFGLISEALHRSPGLTASRLLRELRDGGYACEQQRFGRLFRTFVEAWS